MFLCGAQEDEGKQNTEARIRNGRLFSQLKVAYFAAFALVISASVLVDIQHMFCDLVFCQI